VFSLLDPRHVVCYGCLSQYFEPFEDAVVGKVELTIAVPTVFLGGLFEGTLLRDVSLFMAVIAEAVATSASKERTLYQTTDVWGKGHPIFGCRMYQGVGHVSVSDLL